MIYLYQIASISIPDNWITIILVLGGGLIGWLTSMQVQIYNLRSDFKINSERDQHLTEKVADMKTDLNEIKSFMNEIKVYMEVEKKKKE